MEWPAKYSKRQAMAINNESLLRICICGWWGLWKLAILNAALFIGSLSHLMRIIKCRNCMSTKWLGILLRILHFVIQVTLLWMWPTFSTTMLRKRMVTILVTPSSTTWSKHSRHLFWALCLYLYSRKGYRVFSDPVSSLAKKLCLIYLNIKEICILLGAQ